LELLRRLKRGMLLVVLRRRRQDRLHKLGLRYLLFHYILLADFTDMGWQLRGRNVMELLMMNKHLRRKSFENPGMPECFIRSQTSLWVPI
jgi:hypothetical protein